MKIKITAISDVGKERENNEDAYTFCSDLNDQSWENTNKDYIALRDLGSISILADGMGGAEAGEVASGLAIEVLKKRFQPQIIKEVVSQSSSSIYEFLKSCICDANKSILDYELEHPDVLGMGTTIVVAWLIGQHLYVAWCGDSRCYIFNPSKGLKAITKDHSYVQELIDKKEITEEAAFNHPDSNIITRCLGDVNSSSEPDIKSVKLIEGDLILLCSDGLCGYCKDNQIENLLFERYEDIDSCCKGLISMALDAGGYDNITVSTISTIADKQSSPSLPLSAKLKRAFTNLF